MEASVWCESCKQPSDYTTIHELTTAYAVQSFSPLSQLTAGLSLELICSSLKSLRLTVRLPNPVDLIDFQIISQSARTSRRTIEIGTLIRNRLGLPFPRSRSHEGHCNWKNIIFIRKIASYRDHWRRSLDSLPNAWVQTPNDNSYVFGTNNWKPFPSHDRRLGVELVLDLQQISRLWSRGTCPLVLQSYPHTLL